MKKNLRYLAGAAVGAMVALGFSSCAYDPYYSTSVGGSYSSGGYGDGYGYGGSSFSTSVFVGTGDPRWGYDPDCYSYYDYRSRRYYDPYLNGYYPIGYRPPVVYGVPHPYGWRPGGGYCPPPRHISNVTVVNYRDRESRYRNSNYGWAKQVRQRPLESGRVQGQRPPQNRYNDRQSQNSRTNNASRPPSSTYSRESQTRDQYNNYSRQGSRPDVRQEGRVPSRYGSPVNSPQQQARQGQRPGQRQQATRPQQQPNEQRGNRNTKGKAQSRAEEKRVQGYR
ncbi:MAG: hypothetical protein V4584_18900 [Verrucomicrobiota bacterium]